MNVPCIDISTSRLYLKFKSKEEASLEAEKLWINLKLSSKEAYCIKCNSWHLLDSQGLPVTGNQRLTYRKLNQRVQTGNSKGQRKCVHCKSSEGNPKTIFANLQEAQDVIDSLDDSLEHPLWAYKCIHGNGVHLTKNAHAQSIGIVKQKYTSHIDYQIIDVEPAGKNLNKISRTAPEPPIQKKENTITKIVCKSCGYKLNQDIELKCALCGQYGPYETTTVKD